MLSSKTRATLKAKIPLATKISIWHQIVNTLEVNAPTPPQKQVLKEMKSVMSQRSLYLLWWTNWTLILVTDTRVTKNGIFTVKLDLNLKVKVNQPHKTIVTSFLHQPIAGYVTIKILLSWVELIRLHQHITVFQPTFRCFCRWRLAALARAFSRSSRSACSSQPLMNLTSSSTPRWSTLVHGSGGSISSPGSADFWSFCGMDQNRYIYLRKGNT